MNRWRPRWRFAAFALVPAAAVASYLALWTLQHRTITYVVPCGYNGPFFIAYELAGEAHTHRMDYWNYEYRFDATGRLDVEGALPTSPWVYPIVREACDPPRESRLDWRLALGTRYLDGRELFAYTCHYPATLSPAVCDDIVEETLEKKSAPPS